MDEERWPQRYGRRVRLRALAAFKSFAHLAVSRWLSTGNADLLLQPRFNEGVDVAIEHGVRISGLHVGAEILHHLVRMKDVRPNLAPPLVLALFPFRPD